MTSTFVSHELFNLDFLIPQLNFKNWTQIHCKNVINEYKRFLNLRAINYKLSPCNDVDIVWHQHILNTMHYRNYCMRRYGKIVEHNPEDSFDQKKKIDAPKKHIE